MQINTTIHDHRIGIYAAIAIGIHIVEATLPSPLPGIKPGVANIITLFIAYKMNYATAAWVNLIRIFAGNLLIGQLFSPTFFLSLAGGLASMSALYLGLRLSKKLFSAVSLSILMALAHVGGQLLSAGLWLIPFRTIVYFLPIFFLSALFFGIINGWVVNKLLNPSP